MSGDANMDRVDSVRAAVRSRDRLSRSMVPALLILVAAVACSTSPGKPVNQPSPTRSPSAPPAGSPSASPAGFAAKPTWASLSAAVASYGRDAEVSAPAGPVAVVIHATGTSHGYGVGEAADVLTDLNGVWQLTARVKVQNVGVGVPLPSATYGLPRTGNQWSAQLTGGTDFVLPAFVLTDAQTSAVLSDVGGRWHMVRFHSHQPPSTALGNVVVGAVVVETDGTPTVDGAHDRQFITGTDNCTPNCAGGTTIYQRWTYQTTDGAFTPVGSTFTVADLPHVYTTGCPGEAPPTFEPKEIPITCADYNTTLTGITWSSWTATGAQGTGIYNINNCIPDCAGGTFHHSATAVTLSDPVSTKTQGLVFARVSFVKADGSPGSDDYLGPPANCAQYLTHC